MKPTEKIENGHSLTSGDIDINKRFESQWKYHLEYGAKLPNDAWIKELARHFFKLGWHNLEDYK